MISSPTESEYAPFYADYVSAVPEGDILQLLDAQRAQVRKMASAVPADRETYRYGPDKWSIREVIGHLTDAERVFGYRAFCISRGEAQPLPRFDEDAYVEASGSDARALASLVDEFVRVRSANLDVYEHLSDEAWQRVGTASGQPVSVRALAYISVGHAAHHLNILRERYGVE